MQPCSVRDVDLLEFEAQKPIVRWRYMKCGRRGLGLYAVASQKETENVLELGIPLNTT